MLAPFMPASTALPIWKIHDDILRTLRGGNRLVLVAPSPLRSIRNTQCCREPSGPFHNARWAGVLNA